MIGASALLDHEHPPHVEEDSQGEDPPQEAAEEPLEVLERDPSFLLTCVGCLQGRALLADASLDVAPQIADLLVRRELETALAAPRASVRHPRQRGSFDRVCS